MSPALHDCLDALARAATAAGNGVIPAGLRWQDRALCAEVDSEIFFPEKGGSTRDAKQVCRACEVRAECLAYALEHGIRFGIWGGVTERDRVRLRRASPAPVTPAEEAA